ncbi:Riboflavin synthase [Fusobacterium sp. DD29]|nr:Riboflavin synthase [Fusobacterium sp. DD45]MBR8711604.1 Riboflavin synthase [Fusobacterium sp. DD28]MBR8749600.1 Riboflavin synthase [Fusobacterium sp. DD29]MBR8752153.1 Riboflavin synthase [Fusobacterium sp. DD26]MBR8761861.1 Riboflavin synthase [Fusobacterium sp. DD25]MBR8767879.1 Riboflavin synthase [Fusobacterium sp. DD43]MBR8771897.1 Riboflavin synthase [Fusobacterium sp. DD40]MBR8776150.1 Riboflavin synthase [Fusobacterium sp. DD17]MBR8798417.1 Riboflavin synthase [Fusobacterium s
MSSIFTGLIEEMGEIISVENGNRSLKVKVRCKKVLENAKLGDSIATNGTCLTATELGNDYFTADCMYETVKRTNLKRLKKGDKVNLEKSITLSTPLGGHLVTGDVDCEGKIVAITQEGIAKIYEIEIEHRYMKYIVEKGRVTLDGASLTVMKLTDRTFGVSLIPHTQEMITLGKKKVGDYINVETDLVGKYIERLMNFKEEPEEKSGGLTMEFLLKNGF